LGLIPYTLTRIANQHLAFARMVGLGNDALFFHLFHNARGPIIPNLEFALDVRRGGALVAADNGNRLIVEIIA